jgi:hypothetical protein
VAPREADQHRAAAQVAAVAEGPPPRKVRRARARARARTRPARRLEGGRPVPLVAVVVVVVVVVVERQRRACPNAPPHLRRRRRPGLLVLRVRIIRATALDAAPSVAARSLSLGTRPVTIVHPCVW